MHYLRRYGTRRPRTMAAPGPDARRLRATIRRGSHRRRSARRCRARTRACTERHFDAFCAPRRHTRQGWFCLATGGTPKSALFMQWPPGSDRRDESTMNFSSDPFTGHRGPRFGRYGLRGKSYHRVLIPKIRLIYLDGLADRGAATTRHRAADSKGGHHRRRHDQPQRRRRPCTRRVPGVYPGDTG